MDKHIVRDESGRIDITASKEVYGKALENWVENNEISMELIENAVEKAFDTVPGRLLMPALLTLAVSNLKIKSEQHSNATKQVQDYIKSQKQSGRIQVGIGRKDGGVKRIAKPGEKIPAKA